MSLVLGLCLTLDTCCLLSPPCLCSWDCVLHWILVVYSTHHVFDPVAMFYTGYMLHDASSMSLFLGLYFTLESCFILPPACLCSWDCVVHLKHVAASPHYFFVPGTVPYTGYMLYHAPPCLCSLDCVLHWIHVVSCPHHVFVPGTVPYAGYMLHPAPPCLFSWDYVLPWKHVASCPTMSLFLGL